MSRYVWSRTDNAAVMFSAMDTKNRSRILRFSIVLKNEEIDPQRLQIAVNKAMKRFPGFMNRNVPGFFWSYFEHTDIIPEVKQETLMPGRVRRLGKDGAPEIEIFYYKRRITVEGTHALADGTGYMELLKSITAEYLMLGGTELTKPDDLRLSGQTVSPAETENAFDRYKTKESFPEEKFEHCYCFPKNYAPFGYINTVSGIMPVSELKAQSKPLGLTVTEYLTAVIIYSVIKTSSAPITQPVVIQVPANMRKVMPTETVRNFSKENYISFNPAGRKDVPFPEICSHISGQLSNQSDIGKSQAFLNSVCKLIDNPFIKLIPYPIKHYGLNKIQIRTKQTKFCAVFSNLGNVTLPAEMTDKIERIDFIGGDPILYDQPYFFAASGFNGYVNMTWNCNLTSDLLCAEFFRFISSHGISVRIESADKNGLTEAPAADKSPKYCPVCSVESGEEYTECPLCRAELTVNAEPKITCFKTAEYPKAYACPDNSGTRKYKTKMSAQKLRAMLSL